MGFEVSTGDRVDVVDVTDRVRSEVPADVTGVCTVFVEHTTAGVVVNENESRLLRDIEHLFEDLVPEDGGYHHDRLDGNADAHLRSMLLGESVTIPVQDGSLGLGTWQSVLFVECDGPRTRQVTVTITD